MSKSNPLLSKYELLETIGTGAFSEVKIGRHLSTGERCAIKVIDKARCRGKENMIETEVKILQKVKHENIVQLYEMFEFDNKIYLVMELVTGGELFDDIVGRGKYTEVDASRFVQKILCAVEYLHSMGIVHRDLKPENLLLSEKSANAKIMISDFGLSKIFNDDELMKTACGTPGYVAPEVLRRQGYGREIDLWSLGVITYILLCGYPPFYDQNTVELFKQIMAGRYAFDHPWWDNVSDMAKDFIRRLLVLDPKSRYTARQALDHPFIVKHCGVTAQQNISSSMETVCESTGSSESINNLAPSMKANLARSMTAKALLKQNEGNEKTKEQERQRQFAASAVNTPNSMLLQPGPRRLRILTYNIFLRPPGLRNNLSDYKDSRLVKFGEQYLKNYDVAAFQELYAYGSSRQHKMLQMARKAGYEYYVCSPTKGLLNASVDGGLMILSRYPIVKTEKLSFKKGNFSDRFSSRGALYAKIAISPSLCIHVVNAHLQAENTNRSSTDPNNLSRLQQICLLKEFIDDCVRYKSAHEPILLLGDLAVNARASNDNGAHSQDYYRMMQILSGHYNVDVARECPSPFKMVCHDLIFEVQREHPITLGDVVDSTTRIPKETTLTSQEDLQSCMSVDYMILMNNEHASSPARVDLHATKVEPFEVKGEPYTQLSDHYGLSTVIHSQ